MSQSVPRCCLAGVRIRVSGFSQILVTYVWTTSVDRCTVGLRRESRESSERGFAARSAGPPEKPEK